MLPLLAVVPLYYCTRRHILRGAIVQHRAARRAEYHLLAATDRRAAHGLPGRHVFRVAGHSGADRSAARPDQVVTAEIASAAARRAVHHLHAAAVDGRAADAAAGQEHIAPPLSVVPTALPPDCRYSQPPAAHRNPASRSAGLGRAASPLPTSVPKAVPPSWMRVHKDERALTRRVPPIPGQRLIVEYKGIIYTSMERFKRNQIEDAILRTLDATDARATELKLRMKRLLVTDRRLGRGKRIPENPRRHYAFYSHEAPGSGVEVMFSAYEAFALLTGLLMLEHRIPQATVVSILRQLRSDLERAHRDTLRKDPQRLFDPLAVQAMTKPGMIEVDNAEPIFLVFVKLSGSTAKRVDELITVCDGHGEMNSFIKKHSVAGLGTTFFELVSLMHQLSTNLVKTRPVKRGRSSI